MQWIIAHWWWVVVWLIPGLISTYFVLDCQEWPVRKYTKDNYLTLMPYTKHDQKVVIWLGQTVISISPFILFCSLLLVIFWPSNLLLLWVMYITSD